MKIDFVITGMDIGGAEMQVVDLLIELKKRSHLVRLISLTPPEALTQRLLENNIPVISLDMKSKFSFINAIIRLRLLLLENRTDVVHGHMFHANILIRVVRLFLGTIPIICTAHSTREGGKLRDWVYKLTNRLSSLNTVVSDVAKKRFVGEKVFPEKNTVTVFNGIDTEIFVSLQKPVDSIFHWVTVGRLVSLKNHIAILKAMKSLPDSDLTIIGDGPERNNLLHYVNENGLSDRVTFAGVRKDLTRFYNSSNAFVLASDYEGFALVVAEAMSCGLMVVSTDCGGPADIMGNDHRVGRLVPPGDDLKLSLAMQGIEALGINERISFGMVARNTIEQRFSLKKIVSQWELIYQNLTVNKSLS